MILVVRDDLTEETQERLKDAFLQVISEAEGQDLLFSLEEITGFVEPDEVLREAIELIDYAKGLADEFGDWPQAVR
jgi:ABC-type phosphate/phosphonate transport system substrate-binding protein